MLSVHDEFGILVANLLFIYLSGISLTKEKCISCSLTLTFNLVVSFEKIVPPA
nr:hypothetical protein [Mycoplasmopsis bovis]